MGKDKQSDKYDGPRDQNAQQSDQNSAMSSLAQNANENLASSNDLFSLSDADLQNAFGSNNDLSSFNTEGSGNVNGSDNTAFTGNAANIGNTIASGNSAASQNALGSGNTSGSGNTISYTTDMLTANEILSGNRVGSGNEIMSGNAASKLENIQDIADGSEIEMNSTAAREVIEAEESSSVTADDFAISMNSLMGDGNDARSVAENTNELDDTDQIEDITLNLGPASQQADAEQKRDRDDDDERDSWSSRQDDQPGIGQVFEQTVTAQAEKASVGDGMDDGQSLTGITGDVDLSVAIGASAAAAAMAEGALQELRSGSNTALNEATVAAVGQNESVDLSETMSVSGQNEGNDIQSGNVEDSNNTVSSGNTLASDNVVGADNTVASGNDILSGNEVLSDNTSASGNDIGVDKDFGSDNLIGSNNDILSDNVIGSNNTQITETNKIEIENEAKVDVTEVAAADLVEAEENSDILLDDLTVDYGTLTGAGNDMAFDLDQANSLVDSDSINDISLNLAGSFEQTVEATAGEAFADDATDGGAGTMLADIIGNVSIDVANTADASAVADAQGITQTIASGGNVMLNSMDMSITGGDSSFVQSADDIIG